MNIKEKDLQDKSLFGPNAETQERIMKYYQNRGLFKYDHSDDEHEKMSRDGSHDGPGNK